MKAMSQHMKTVIANRATEEAETARVEWRKAVNRRSRTFCTLAHGNSMVNERTTFANYERLDDIAQAARKDVKG